jgi:hypothetical protein
MNNKEMQLQKVLFESFDVKIGLTEITNFLDSSI